MPRTRECDYCGDDIEPGTGTLVVMNDGSTIDYCSSKCEKNADLGREPREVEWTESGRAGKGPAVEEETEDESDVEADTEDDEAETEDERSEAAPDLEAAEEDAEVDEETADADDTEDEEADEDELEEEEAEA